MLPTMRVLHSFALLVGAVALSSCQVKVDLVVANLTSQPINIMLASTPVSLPPHTERRFDNWPDDHKLTVVGSDCARTFDLDEHYSTADEWRYSTFNNVRRFGIFGAETVRIMLPDQAHSADRHAGFSSPPPPNLDLTPTPRSCPSR
jgi:hypothetical protein